MRVINLLDTVGKMFFSTLWKCATDVREHNSYGFYKERRREQAIVVQNAVTWKLRHIGLGHCCVYHDVSNAFPSPFDGTFNDTMQRVGHEDDVHLLQYRYSNSRLRIDTGAQGSVLVHPGSGGMQGDVSMAQIFRTMFDEGLREWDERPDYNTWLL